MESYIAAKYKADDVQLQGAFEQYSSIYEIIVRKLDFCASLIRIWLRHTIGEYKNQRWIVIYLTASSIDHIPISMNDKFP